MIFGKKLKVKEIFVPGGFPDKTYISRNEKGLENKIIDALDSLNKLIMITGLTKSGKTVIVRKILRKKGFILCDCGIISKENDFWEFILSEIDGYNSVSRANSQSTSTEREFSLLTIPISILNAIGLKYKKTKQRQTNIQISRSVAAKTETIRILKQYKMPLVLDDFHYLNRDLQGILVRALKGCIFEGLPVIFIAIPHRRLDALKVEREMTGRVETIQIPTWELEELKSIANIGFPLLKLKIDSKIIDSFAAESFGSPHLMQEFCYNLCKTNGINFKQKKITEIGSYESIEKLYNKVAENTGKVIYDKLAKGPRQRTDRIKRPLKSGIEVDIYGVILLALVELKPGLSTVTYEQLREAIRRILSDKVPNIQEVSRVLDNMSKIALSDESSTPVIDWEKEESKLHITDPFFAYYLKWGEIKN